MISISLASWIALLCSCPRIPACNFEVYFATVAATFASFSHVRIICLLIGTYHDQDRNFLFFFHEITLCFVVVKYVRHDQNAKEMWNNDQKRIE